MVKIAAEDIIMIPKNQPEDAAVIIEEQKEIDCIVTAAGLSTRMGQWKLMLPYRQGTILDASIENALSFCQRVILVVGFRGDELIKRYLNHRGIIIVTNADYQSGLFSSVRCGARRAQGNHVFITHGDLPNLSGEIYAQLWQRRGEYALFPSYHGVSGHPVLLPQAQLQRIAAAELHQSVKALLRQEPCQLLPMTTPQILADVDTPESYQQLLDSENNK